MRINDEPSVSGASEAREGPPTEEEIRALVHHFYARVREDELLGPVFGARIDDWEPHLARMCDFWSGILRASGRYRGNPLQAHAAIPGLEARHFGRWLALFRGSAEATLPAAAARDVVARAERMSRVLMRNRPEPSQTAGAATSSPHDTPAPPAP